MMSEISYFQIKDVKDTFLIVISSLFQMKTLDEITRNRMVISFEQAAVKKDIRTLRSLIEKANELNKNAYYQRLLLEAIDVLNK